MKLSKLSLVTLCVGSIFICLLFIQTYAIHHRGDNAVEVCTYVCEVYYDGPAYVAGMRPGK